MDQGIGNVLSHLTSCLTPRTHSHAQPPMQVPMGRAGQPSEVAPAFVFLASNCCSSYITGSVLHCNGGVPVTA